jgi:hypothetical protein
MIVEAALSSVLAAVPGCEFWPVQLPDPDGTIPDVFGIYLKAGGPSFQDIEGDIDLSQPRMQISIYATSYGRVKAIETAVNAAMAAANASGVLKNYSASVPADQFDSETRRYYIHMDFHCWSNE